MENQFDKKYYELRRGELEVAYNAMKPDWQELADYFLPRSVRFLSRTVNKTPIKNKKIKDSAPLKAVRNFSSGMMSGATNPVDTWFRVKVHNYDTKSDYQSRIWCQKVEDLFQNIFNVSNFYQNLPASYEQLGVFGLSVMCLEEDTDTILNTKLLPVGSYRYAKNHKGEVDTMCRVYMESAINLIHQFGEENVSHYVLNAIKSKRYEEMFEIVHFVEPNSDFEFNSPWAKNKKYKSVYYELVGENDKCLNVSGFDKFPFVVFEASVNGEDVYPSNCCGINALPDVKQLMSMVIDEAKAVKKMVSPTYKGPAELKNKKMIDAPAAFVEENQNGRGLSPVYEVDPRILEVERLIENKRNSIYDLFFNDLFSMILNTTTTNRTATEVNELKEEKMILLSQLLQQVHSGLKQVIEWLFSICIKRGLIENPPFILQNKQVEIEFVSMLAQAQKTQKISSMELFSAFAINLANSVDSSLLMKINGAKMIDDYADFANIKSDQVNSDETVKIQKAKIKEGENQQNAMEILKDGSDVVKNLGGIENIENGNHNFGV